VIYPKIGNPESSVLTRDDYEGLAQPLGTDSYAKAIRRIHRAAAIVEGQLERARAQMGRSFDPTLSAPWVDGLPPDLPASQPASPPPSNTPALIPPRPIGEVYDQFIADPRHAWSKRTVTAHGTTRKWVVEAFGADTAITDTSREKCREFVDLLRRMPAHADRAYRAVVQALAAQWCG